VVQFGGVSEPLLVEDLEKEGVAMGIQDSYDAICAAAREALIKLKDK
jgi:hypothetical protein